MFANTVVKLCGSNYSSVPVVRSSKHFLSETSMMSVFFVEINHYKYPWLISDIVNHHTTLLINAFSKKGMIKRPTYRHEHVS